MRPTDLMPKGIIDMLLSLYRIDPEWVGPIKLEEGGFRCDPVTNLRRLGADPNALFVRALMADGARSVTAFYGVSVWLGTGPKIFRPSIEQETALEQVEVNIRMVDYQQPYPALLVELPRNGKFRAILAFHRPPLTCCYLFARDRRTLNGDTIIVLGGEGPDGVMEHALLKWDKECETEHVEAEKACRVALNSCLALTHYDHRTDYLYPKEVASDRNLARESSERGQRAKGRIQLAVQVVSFAQEVKLYCTEGGTPPSGDQLPTGRQMPVHWRRGHWAMQTHGPRHSLRKRIFRPPVLVREDLFVGEMASTITIYRGET